MLPPYIVHAEYAFAHHTRMEGSKLKPVLTPNRNSSDTTTSVAKETVSRHLLSALALCTLLPALDTSLVNANLPLLAQSFHTSLRAVQWVVLMYLLSMTCLVVGAGRLADIHARRVILLAGIALFSLSALAAAMAPNLAFLLVARAGQGLGAAIMSALAIASVGDAVPKEKTGRAMGLLGTMSAVGTCSGPVLAAIFGGILRSTDSAWRYLFVPDLLLGLIIFLLIWRYLPVADIPPAGSKKKFDIGGMLVLAVSLAAFALGLSLLRGYETPDTAWYASWHGGVLLLLLAAAASRQFARMQVRSAAPLLDMRILRTPVFGHGLLLNLLVAAVMMSTLVIGPFYLLHGLGLNAWQSGLVLAAGPLASAICGVPAGRLVDQFGAARMLKRALLLMCSACLALSLLPLKAGVLGYLLPILCLTPGYALFQAANNTGMLAQITPDQRGLISALLSLARNLGLISGAAFIGSLFAGLAGAMDHAQQVSEAMRVCFAVAAGMAGVGLLLAGRMGKAM